MKYSYQNQMITPGRTLKMNKKIVLLVDDDDDFLFQQEYNLKQLGYDVIKASGVIPAKEIITHIKPDIAIIDLMMEEMDGGFILAYFIKTIDPSIPVIMTTAVGNTTGICFDSSSDPKNTWIKVDKILQKPVRLEELEKELLKFVGR